MTEAIERYIRRNSFTEFSPKAVLFDMDGVLYNSMPNHAKAWVKCMTDCGVTMSEEEAYMCEGMRGVETIQLIAGRQWKREITTEEAESIYRRKSEIYSKLPEAELINGVYNLQKNIVKRGWTIGVVTGSGQKSLLQRIENDFEGLVSPDVLVCAKDVKHGKPAPDPYIKGMEKAGTRPWETIVIENAPLGVRAAVAAHCFTIAVNTGPLPHSIFEQEGADMVFPSMDALNESLARIFPSDGDNPSC